LPSAAASHSPPPSPHPLSLSLSHSLLCASQVGLACAVRQFGSLVQCSGAPLRSAPPAAMRRSGLLPHAAAAAQAGGRWYSAGGLTTVETPEMGESITEGTYAATLKNVGTDPLRTRVWSPGSCRVLGARPPSGPHTSTTTPPGHTTRTALHASLPSPHAVTARRLVPRSRAVLCRSVPNPKAPCLQITPECNRRVLIPICCAVTHTAGLSPQHFDSHSRFGGRGEQVMRWWWTMWCSRSRRTK
jgi:hypothetical protein